jgi:hypothetical protein
MVIVDFLLSYSLIVETRLTFNIHVSTVIPLPSETKMAQMTQYEIEGLWVDNRLDVAYHFNDAVRFKFGEHVGKTGRVVALFTLEPFPTYVMEFPDGTSGVAIEPDLERAG